ncbi:MAG: tetratricopeptide repeat protein [Terriglobia bacterium]
MAEFRNSSGFRRAAGACGCALRRARSRAHRLAGATTAAAAVLLISALAWPAAARAQAPAGVTINSSEQVFAVMAALNAAGYNTGLYASTGDNTRLEARAALAKEHIPVLPQIAQFYASHRIADPGLDFAQYVSLALFLGPPPDFKLTVDVADLPPAAALIRDLVPLVRTFYQQADLHELYLKLQPSYVAAIQSYAPTTRRDIVLTDAYLRSPAGEYLGRQYHIYLCLLGPPEQAQARIYREDYYLVITPSVDPRYREIRHQYLHFLLDPLAVKYAADVHQKAALLAVARTAPGLEEYDKHDFSMLLTECLIRAVELRMEQPKDAQQQAESALRLGYILTPYFYTALAAYEKQPSSLSVYYPQLIGGIDLDKMDKVLAGVKFTSPQPSPVVETARTLSPKDRLLDQGDNLIYASRYQDASEAYKQVLKKYDPHDERALYGLAVAATSMDEPDVAEKYFKQTLKTARDLRIVTWSHIYLARIYDLEGERDEALQQYRAADVTAGGFPEALAALRRGLQHPFAPMH